MWLYFLVCSIELNQYLCLGLAGFVDDNFQNRSGYVLMYVYPV